MVFRAVSHSLVCVHGFQGGVTFTGMRAWFSGRCHIHWYACMVFRAVSHSLVCVHGFQGGVTFTSMRAWFSGRCHIH